MIKKIKIISVILTGLLAGLIWQQAQAIYLTQLYNGQSTTGIFDTLMAFSNLTTATTSAYNSQLVLKFNLLNGTTTTPTPWIDWEWQNTVNKSCSGYAGEYNWEHARKNNPDYPSQSDFSYSFNPDWTTAGEKTLTITVSSTTLHFIPNRQLMIRIAPFKYTSSPGGTQKLGDFLGSSNADSYADGSSCYNGGTATTTVADNYFFWSQSFSSAFTPTAPLNQTEMLQNFNFTGTYTNEDYFTGAALRWSNGTTTGKYNFPITTGAGISYSLNSLFIGANLPGDYTYGFTFYNLNGVEVGTTSPPYEFAFSIFSGAAMPTSTQNSGAAFPINLETPAPPAECSFTNISQCFIDVFQYLFIPNNDIFTAYNDLYAIISLKPPMGYILTGLEAWQTVSTSTATTTTYMTDTVWNFVKPYMLPIRNGLTVLLWLLCGFYLIKRLSKLEL